MVTILLWIWTIGEICDRSCNRHNHFLEHVFVIDTLCIDTPLDEGVDEIEAEHENEEY